MSTPLRILGVMTGTSCDGLDAACVEFSKNKFRLIWKISSHYPVRLRNRIISIQEKPSCSLKDILFLNKDLSLWYADTLQKTILKHVLKPDVIANHGQTIAHIPPLSTNKIGSTLQLGDPALIAAKTGITVVSSFRNGDLAVGGQGAPLAPLFHEWIIKKYRLGHGVAIHNLGGISNLTYFGPMGFILAFDTGPGNTLIDSATTFFSRGKQLFDKDGLLAKQGKADHHAVAKLLKNSFFKLPPPKSTGRDCFPLKWLLSHTKSRNVDLITTATLLTVESIVFAYQKWILEKNLPLKQIYFCGGGSKNRTIINLLKDRLSPVCVFTLEKIGLTSQTVEAEAFAYLGLKSLLGESLGGSWTGAKSFGPPGSLTPGKNWKNLIKKIQTWY